MNTYTDKERLDFLIFVYFGVDTLTFDKAVDRAYRDFCRTLTQLNGRGKEYREKAMDILKKGIQKLCSAESCEKFDYYHNELCNEIKNIDNSVFSHGKVQKWVNMTMKYLYVFDCDGFDFSKVTEYMHIPLDSYVLQALDGEDGVSMYDGGKHKKWKHVVWSKLDEDTYEKIQTHIRLELKKKYPNTYPINWEFEKWLKIAIEEKKINSIAAKR